MGDNSVATLPKILSKDFKPFWKEDLSDDQYHSKNEFMGSSGLKQILRSPLHFYELVAKGSDERETPALRLGKLIHAAVLEPDRFTKNMVVSPDFNRRSKTGRESEKRWLEERLQSDIVVGQKEYDTILAVVERIYEHPVARGVLAGGEREWSGFFRDDRTGVACKIRPDLMFRSDGMILDVKTCLDASRTEFQRAIWKYRYDLQAAFYLNGARIIEGRNFDQYFILAVEKTPPYLSALYQVDGAAIETGEIAFRKALRRYCTSISMNKWPGYQDMAESISVPEWALKVTEEDYPEHEQEEEKFYDGGE